MQNPVIVTVAGGFYYFGNEIESIEDGYITLNKAAMFGGFSGGFGMPGVAAGKDGATVTLNTFDENMPISFPVNNVYAIHKSVDLYKFKGTTIK